MKQTAVQYIEDNYSLGKTLGEMKVILATAREMEKQEMIEAFNAGVDNPYECEANGSDKK